MKPRRISLYGLLIALAFVFSYIENMLTIPMWIPGIKLGLAHVVVLAALYLLGGRCALFVSVVRVVLAGLSYGSVTMAIYSLAGCSLSFLIMVSLKQTGRFGMPGVSIAGGVAHNIGQIIVAAILLETTALTYYLPFLLVSGCVTGAAIGVAGAEIVKRAEGIVRSL